MTDNNFQLPILETVNLAWHKVKGVKFPFCAAIAFVAVITYFNNRLGASLATASVYYRFTVFGIGTAILILLQAGLLYLGLQRANEAPISFRALFHAFEPTTALKVIGFYLLKVLIFFPITLVILFSIYLSDAAYKENLTSLLLIAILVGTIAVITLLFFALRLFVGMAFVLDKKVNPWNALKLSFRATRSNYWHLLGLVLVEVSIVIAGIVSLGIGLIWAAPLLLILYGMVYKKLSLNIPKAPYSKEEELFYCLNKRLNPGLS